MHQFNRQGICHMRLINETFFQSWTPQAVREGEQFEGLSFTPSCSRQTHGVPSRGTRCAGREEGKVSWRTDFNNPPAPSGPTVSPTEGLRPAWVPHVFLLEAQLQVVLLPGELQWTHSCTRPQKAPMPCSKSTRARTEVDHALVSIHACSKTIPAGTQLQ